MKKLNQIAVLFAAATIAGTAFADITGANWRNGDGQLVWKNGDQTLCWQTPHWTPATAASQECGMPPRLKKTKKIIRKKVIRKKAKKVLPPPPPPPPPLPPKPVVVVAAEEMRYAADTFFNFDRHTLKPEGKKVLQELVQKVKKLNLEIVITTGHTDSIGTAKYNMRLSERRAHTVKKYLVSLGIPQSKILAEGRGEANPIASNKTSAGRAKNRRVEIEVVGVLR